jgi:hypothetical protein
MTSALFTPMLDVVVHFIIARPEVLSLEPAERILYAQKNISPILEHANGVYSQAGIRFIFDPSRDIEYNANAEQLDGEELQLIAGRYHGKMLVFYRGHGGNAGSRAAFFHLDSLNGDNFAHEIGHYFYLPHTFVEGLRLSSLADIIKHGVENDSAGQEALGRITALLADGVPPETGLPYDIEWSKDIVSRIGTRVLNSAIDGDYGYINDTPPALHEYDSATDTPPGFVYCQANFPITVAFSNGYVNTFQFTPDQHNVMGYGHFGGCAPRYLSNDQVKVIRNCIFEGGRRHLTEARLLWTGWAALPRLENAKGAPGAAALGNRMYVVRVGSDGRIFIISAQDGYSFEHWEEIAGGGTTKSGAAIAALGNRLYVFATGINDGRVYVNSAASGASFEQWAPLPVGPMTNLPPAAASLGNRIYVACTGVDNRIYISSAQDGSPFESWVEVPGDGTTDAPVAAASLERRLYLIGKGIDNNRLYVNSAADGAPFHGWEQVPGEMRTFLQPAAAFFGSRLFLAANGKDKNIYYVSAPSEQPFGKWLEVPIGGQTDAAVTAASLGQRFYVFAEGLDNNIYVNSAHSI